MKIDVEKMDLIIAEKGMMLKDVAEQSGLSENSFRNIRKGVSIPRLKTIGRIATTLGVGVQEIIKEGDED